MFKSTFLSSGYSRVAQNTKGLWHTSCISGDFTNENAAKVCRKLGFKNATLFQWRLNENSQEFSGNLTKVVIENSFMPLKINDFFTIDSFKSSRAHMRLAAFDPEDQKSCRRLEIKCD